MEDENKNFIELFRDYTFGITIKTVMIGSKKKKNKQEIVTDVECDRPYKWDEGIDEPVEMPDELFNKVCYTKDYLVLSKSSNALFNVAFPKPTEEGFTPRHIMNAVADFEIDARSIFKISGVIDHDHIHFEGFQDENYPDRNTFSLRYGS